MRGLRAIWGCFNVFYVLRSMKSSHHASRCVGVHVVLSASHTIHFGNSLSIVFANTFLDCVALFYVNPIPAASLQWVADPGWESVFIFFHLDFCYFCWSTYPLALAYTYIACCSVCCQQQLCIDAHFHKHLHLFFYDTFSFSILLAQQSLIVGYREQEKTCVWYFFGQANIPTEFSL